MPRAWPLPGLGLLPAQDRPTPRGGLHLLLLGPEGSSSGQLAHWPHPHPSESPSSAPLFPPLLSLSLASPFLQVLTATLQTLPAYTVSLAGPTCQLKTGPSPGYPCIPSTRTSACAIEGLTVCWAAAVWGESVFCGEAPHSGPAACLPFGSTGFSAHVQTRGPVGQLPVQTMLRDWGRCWQLH